MGIGQKKSKPWRIKSPRLYLLALNSLHTHIDENVMFSRRLKEAMEMQHAALIRVAAAGVITVLLLVSAIIWLRLANRITKSCVFGGAV